MFGNKQVTSTGALYQMHLLPNGTLEASPASWPIHHEVRPTGGLSTVLKLPLHETVSIDPLTGVTRVWG